MRFVIQRVANACVKVDNEIVGQIEKGFMVLIGITQDDTCDIADKMVHKMLHLRIFQDQQDKTNLDLNTVNGSLLLISQFTLYADCKKGNRPNFIQAAPADYANELYEYIIEKCKLNVSNVQTGVFGAHMDVQLTNQGPFTIILDSDEIL